MADRFEDPTIQGNEKIKEAIDFVSGFDWPAIANQVLADMPAYLEKKIL